MKSPLEITAAALWVASGVLWLGSTWVTRPPQPDISDIRGTDGMIDASITITDDDTGVRIDFFGTMERQQKWSRYAAWAAAAAALAQAGVLYFG